MLLKCPGLYMVQTVDSKNLAENLNNAWSKIDFPGKTPLRVLVQVNVSKEDVKSGVEPDEAVNLYQYIRECLESLCVEGVMTIGSMHQDQTTENADFNALMKCHEDIYKKFNITPSDVQVSMGMSNDFEHAVEMGSTIVRVGSSIFGDRAKKVES